MGISAMWVLLHKLSLIKKRQSALFYMEKLTFYFFFDFIIRGIHTQFFKLAR